MSPSIDNWEVRRFKGFKVFELTHTCEDKWIRVAVKVNGEWQCSAPFCHEVPPEELAFLAELCEAKPGYYSARPRPGYEGVIVTGESYDH